LINLLNSICKKHNIPFIDPTIVLSNYAQEQVITSDLGHYTNIGINEFTNYANNYITTILSERQSSAKKKILSMIFS